MSIFHHDPDAKRLSPRQVRAMAAAMSPAAFRRTGRSWADWNWNLPRRVDCDTALSSEEMYGGACARSYSQADWWEVGCEPSSGRGYTLDIPLPEPHRPRAVDKLWRKLRGPLSDLALEVLGRMGEPTGLPVKREKPPTAAQRKAAIAEWKLWGKEWRTGLELVLHKTGYHSVDDLYRSAQVEHGEFKGTRRSMTAIYRDIESSAWDGFWRRPAKREEEVNPFEASERRLTIDRAAVRLSAPDPPRDWQAEAAKWAWVQRRRRP